MPVHRVVGGLVVLFLISTPSRGQSAVIPPDKIFVAGESHSVKVKKLAEELKRLKLENEWLRQDLEAIIDQVDELDDLKAENKELRDELDGNYSQVSKSGAYDGSKMVGLIRDGLEQVINEAGVHGLNNTVGEIRLVLREFNARVQRMWVSQIMHGKNP